MSSPHELAGKKTHILAQFSFLFGKLVVMNNFLNYLCTSIGIQVLSKKEHPFETGAITFNLKSTYLESYKIMFTSKLHCFSYSDFSESGL